MSDPAFSHDLPYCAWAALRLLREREAATPKRVLAGSITAEEAARRTGTARAIVDQWRWAIDPAMPPYPTDDAFAVTPFGADEREMVAQLRETAAWERERWNRTPGDAALRERTLLAEALLWNQTAPSPFSWPRIVSYGFAARRSPSQRYVVDPVEDARLYRDLGLPLAEVRMAA